MSLRTFFAVETPPEFRQQAAELVSELSGCPVKVKWVEPQNVHLTMKFLGDTRDDDVSKICTAVSEAVSTLPAFCVEGHGVGAFPRLDRPRILWIGVRGGDTEIAGLHAALEQCVVDYGFAREGRKFHPHLTIGRVRDGRDSPKLTELLRERASQEFGSFPVSKVTYFSSQLRPHGPVYTPLGHFALKRS